jgi:hypothetical protein
MRELNNYRTKIAFDNGYTASIICLDIYSKGGEEGLFEVAIIHNDELVYDTPITNNVIGHLSFFEIAEVLNKIKNLPPRNA